MLPNILPGSDNFFKYLLTAGLILLFFAIVYPLQQEQKLKFERITLKIEEEKLSNDTAHLRIKMSEIKSLQITIQKQIDVLKKLEEEKGEKSLEIQNSKIELLKYFNEKKEDGLKYANEIEISNLKLKEEKQKIEELKNQIFSYVFFKCIFIIVGILFCLGGFRFWLGTTYADELTKSGQPFDSNYKTSYVRYMNYFRKYIFWTSLTLILLLILVWKIANWLTPL
ncbi:hypothetical protein DBR32_02885 [Taibaiella sp. KBW10]|uniref:hypothetical protein n=1 Tax=Taibaiella sp. KBW10 TaxID=2153357 RepID=UPI000F5AE3C6|nr:hypothetical protein [Taibaiella sp. KBW10]RQO32557.1 hypothetical protein DBR32_02885 [Taibaiella sp. KBW10]